jgi:hypothetical protein
MSKQLTPLEEKIKSSLETFTRKEPYITNTAIRIASLLPRDLQEASAKSIKKTAADDIARAYSRGYAAAKRRYDGGKP